VTAGEPPVEAGLPAPEQPGSSTRIVVAASLILVVGNLVSRLLGWVRLAIIGAQFGASQQLDAYFAAFRIPDTIFQLVVAGTLFVAFIPVFMSYRARTDEAEAWRVASSVINLVVIALAGLSLLMAIFAPLFVPLVAPGFDAPTTELTVRMTRVMLLSPVFLGLGAVVSAVLNGYDEFLVPAIAPVIYNLAIIAAAVFLAPFLGIESLAVGVAVGALGHVLVQLPKLARLSGGYDLTIHFRHPGVVEVAKLMAPRALGLAAAQANFLISTVLASTLAVGSITAYNYAFQLSQVPVAVIGVSVAVALFPTLSRVAALGQLDEVRRQVSTSLRIMFFLSAPITAILVVLREPATAAFYQYGAFSRQSVSQTADALMFFSVALFAHSWVQVVARAFYALHDSRSPVVWAVVAVGVNVILMVWLVGPMGVAGLALALSISSIIEVAGLVVALRTKLGSIGASSIVRSAALSTVSATLSGVVMLLGLQAIRLVAPALLADGLGNLVAVLALSAVGTAVFVAAAWIFRMEDLLRTWGMIRSRRSGG
jgi:putative peptidoglycan lipid II flippase